MAGPTEAVPATQTWVDAPARIAKPKSKPSKTAQKNPDVEVFETGDKGEKTTTKPTIEQPNINIEIHNVFSFGANNSLPHNEETDAKVRIGTSSEKPKSDPQIIFSWTLRF